MTMGGAGTAVRKGQYRVRQDGWTPQRQRAFLRALSETGCVRDACARVRISTTSAYRMRMRCDTFSRAWERALAKVMPTIEQAAFERAVLGWEEAVWHGGRIVGQRRRYSDTLLRLLLTRGIGDARNAGEMRRAADRGEWHQATQAETDAELLKRLHAFKRRHDAEAAARKALPPPGPARTTPATGTGDQDADDTNRRAPGGVRHGDGPRIWTPSA